MDEILYERAITPPGSPAADYIFSVIKLGHRRSSCSPTDPR
jgi:hypothetical protein